MKAYDFSYDNRNLSEFGCILCSFEEKGLETVNDGCEVTFNTIPTMGGSKHNLVSTQYEDCLETTLQLCKHSCNGGIQEITQSEHRELAKWLSRKKFLKLKILDEDHIDLYYEAIFGISKIEIDGKLFGLELAVKTNRPYALKEPRTINIVCEEGKEVYGWEKYSCGSEDEVVKLGYVTSEDEDAYLSGVHADGCQYISVGEVYKSSINDTSYEEGFIYPYTEISVNKDGDLKIHNSIENRETYIANCVAGEVITMDYPVIRSSISSHNIQNDFNWTFFRVANTYENSRNDLVITLPCSIKVKYSPVVKVGL